MYKVEKDIPLSTIRTGGRGPSKLRVFMEGLKAGDSFAVPFNDPEEKKVRSMVTQISQDPKSDHKFTMRLQADGSHRVWCLAKKSSTNPNEDVKP